MAYLSLTYELLMLTFDVALSPFPLSRFIAVTSLPIKLHHENSNTDRENQNPKKRAKFFLELRVLCLFYQSTFTTTKLIMVIYNFHIYLSLELITIHFILIFDKKITETKQCLYRLLTSISLFLLIKSNQLNHHRSFSFCSSSQHLCSSTQPPRVSQGFVGRGDCHTSYACNGSKTQLH